VNEQINRRVPGKRAFAPRECERPKLVLVPSPKELNRPAPKVEPSQEVREMLHELNRHHTNTRDTDTPDAA
jgi:hypothetical protein